MATQDFTLPAFNSVLIPDEATEEKTAPALLTTTHVDAVVEMGITAMRSIFKFTADGDDITDADTDIVFKCNAAAWATECGAKLGDANMNYAANPTTANTTLGSLAAHQPTQYLLNQALVAHPAANMTLQYDVVRDIAAKAFGPDVATSGGTGIHVTAANVANSNLTDVFSNEAAVRLSVFTQANATVSGVTGTIYDAIAAADNLNSSTSADNDANIGRRLLQQILNLDGADSRTGAGFIAANQVVGDASGTYHMPFIVGDTISCEFLQNNASQRAGGSGANGGNKLSQNLNCIDRNIRMIFNIINDINLPPVATAAAGVAVDHNTATTITLAGTDTENVALTFAIATPGSKGVVTMVNANASATTGTVLYTPTAGQYGADSFTFTVTDGVHVSAAATVTVTIGDPPGESLNLFNAHSLAVSNAMASGGNPAFIDHAPDGGTPSDSSILKSELLTMVQALNGQTLTWPGAYGSEFYKLDGSQPVEDAVDGYKLEYEQVNGSDSWSLSIGNIRNYWSGGGFYFDIDMRWAPPDSGVSIRLSSNLNGSTSAIPPSGWTQYNNLDVLVVKPGDGGEGTPYDNYVHEGTHFMVTNT